MSNATSKVTRQSHPVSCGIHAENRPHSGIVHVRRPNGFVKIVEAYNLGFWRWHTRQHNFRAIRKSVRVLGSEASRDRWVSTPGDCYPYPKLP